MSSGVKSGSAKVVGWISPKPPMGADPVMPAKNPGPDAHVAVARVHEQSGHIDEAEAQYKKALSLDANHLDALVGYAHLEDRRNNFEAATRLYQRALKKHATEASVHNDMGLCYHRRAMLDDAVRSLQTALELQPDRKLYRDNLAAVLVDQGKVEEALVQLTRAHGEAVGNYNLAFLLVQQHQNESALVHFRKAVARDPSLSAAQSWIAQLSPTRGQGLPAANGALIADGRPVQLPPITEGLARPDDAGTIPQQRSERVTSGTAPIVPPAANGGLPASVNPDCQPHTSPSVAPNPDARGVQFPQPHRSTEASADAIAPMPQQP